MANTHQTLSNKERNRIDQEVNAEHLSSEAIYRAARELNRKNKSRKKGTPEPKLDGHRRKVTTTVEEVVTNKKGKKYTRKRDKVTYGDLLTNDGPARTDIGYAGDPPPAHGFRSKGDAEQALADIRADQRWSNDPILLAVPDDDAWFKPMGEPDTTPALSDDEYLAEVHFDATHAPGRRMRYMVGSALYASFTCTESGAEPTHFRHKGRLVEVSKDTPAIDHQGNEYRKCMVPKESYREESRNARYNREVKAEAKRQRNA